jgi:hypothetical protein
MKSILFDKARCQMVAYKPIGSDDKNSVWFNHRDKHPSMGVLFH